LNTVEEVKELAHKFLMKSVEKKIVKAMANKEKNLVVDENNVTPAVLDELMADGFTVEKTVYASQDVSIVRYVITWN
jgi:hypothetical protein